jgi:hypothetical protein
MRFTHHSDLVGQHALLGASKHYWLAYSEEQLESYLTKQMAIQRGVELHAFAATCIALHQRLPQAPLTLNMFVNDAIGYRMRTEQPLVYSLNAFGTADAICFSDNLLRIHDLKTGVSPTSMAQLEIYTALFFLEYQIDPKDVVVELRIYQNNTIFVHMPTLERIKDVMDTIVRFDKILTNKLLEMEE